MTVTRSELTIARQEREAAQARLAAADVGLLAEAARLTGLERLDAVAAEAVRAAEEQAAAVLAEAVLLRRRRVEGGPCSARARHAARRRT